MKLFTLILLFLLFILNCSNQPTNSDSAKRVNFFTDKHFYFETDTINFTLLNHSDSTLYIGLRCGTMLEMFYQKKENNIWSDNLLFDYMLLNCPTFLDSVKSDGKFKQSIPATIFKSRGTFRLKVNEEIISNSFDIH